MRPVRIDPTRLPHEQDHYRLSVYFKEGFISLDYVIMKLEFIFALKIGCLNEFVCIFAMQVQISI